MTSEGFELAVLGIEGQRIYDLDREATGIAVTLLGWSAYCT